MTEKYFGIHRTNLDLNRIHKTNERPSVTIIDSQGEVIETVHGVDLYDKDGNKIGGIYTNCIQYFPVEGGLRAWIVLDDEYVHIEPIKEI